MPAGHGSTAGPVTSGNDSLSRLALESWGIASSIFCGAAREIRSDRFPATVPRTPPDPLAEASPGSRRLHKMPRSQP